MKYALVLSSLLFYCLTVGAANVFTSNGAARRTMGVARHVPGGTSFTVEGWIKLAADCPSSHENVLWAQYGTGGPKGRIDLYVRNGRLGLFCGAGVDANGLNTTNETVMSTASIANGVWTHVAFVRDEAARTYALYLDGQPAGGGPSACTTPYACDSTIGGLMSVLDGNDAVLVRGSIADVRVWTVARTATEIARDRTRRLSGSEPGLFIYLPLDRKVGNTTTDIVENEVTMVADDWRLTEDASLVLEPNPVDLEKNAAFSPRAGGVTASVVTGHRLTGTAFTIEGWFNMSLSNTKDGIAYQYPDAGRLSFEVDANTNRYTCWFNGKSLYSPEVPTNTWVHIALVRDGAWGAFFTNGVEASSTTTFSATQAMANRDLTLFAFSVPGTKAFPGMVRELRAWSVARSGEEIRADMGRSITAPTNNLVACWPLREGVGSQIFDCGGTLTNVVSSATAATLWQVGAVPVLQVPAGAQETAAQFTGSRYSSGSTGLSLTETNFTFEVWVRPRPYGLLSGHSDYYHILRQHVNGDAGRTIFALRGGRASFFIGASGWKSGQTVIRPDVWTHLAVTRDGGHVCLYCNGEPDGEWMDITRASPSSGAPLILSSLDSSESFDGWMRELRVWNRACTPKEIRHRFRYRLRGTEEGLLGTYPLDDASTELVNGRRGGPNGTLRCAWTPCEALDLLGVLPPRGVCIVVR